MLDEVSPVDEFADVCPLLPLPRAPEVLRGRVYSDSLLEDAENSGIVLVEGEERNETERLAGCEFGDDEEEGPPAAVELDCSAIARRCRRCRQRSGLPIC